MVKLADTRDLKSLGLNSIPVRVRVPLHLLIYYVTDIRVPLPAQKKQTSQKVRKMENDKFHRLMQLADSNIKDFLESIKNQPLVEAIQVCPLQPKLAICFSPEERKMIVTAIVCFYGKLNLQLLPEETLERYGFTFEDFFKLRRQLTELDEIDVDLMDRGGSAII